MKCTVLVFFKNYITVQKTVHQKNKTPIVKIVMTL